MPMAFEIMHTCVRLFSNTYMQVLSVSMSNALVLSGRPHVLKTVEFASIFDKLFNITNVTNLTNGKRKRKFFRILIARLMIFALRNIHVHATDGM